MKRPPGPPGQFFLGSLLKFQHERLAFLLSLPTYGDITFMRLGQEPVYTLHHPALVKEVLVECPEKFQKLRLTRKLFNQAFGNTPDAMLRKTEAWHRGREIVQSALHTVHIQQYTQQMVELTQKTISQWQTGQILDIYSAMRELTLQIVTRTLFGSDVSDLVGEIRSATADLQLRAARRFNTLVALPLWVPTADNRRIQRAVKTLHRVVDSMIQQYMEEPARSDLLSSLVFSQDTLDKDAIIEEMMSLLISGHETTATLLAWTFYLLSQHPDQEAHLHAELDQILSNRPPTMADIANLPYTEAVIKEAARLYPPAWTISRRAVEDVRIGGYTIPRQALVYINPYSLHRDPRWFDDPESFMPERFLWDGAAASARYAYIPFGVGPRRCIGSAFAMTEAVLVLACVAQRFRLALIAGQRIIPEPLISLRPKNGIRMKVQP